MLLQQIVTQLDTEIERLKAIRKIVAELAHTPAIAGRIIPILEILPVAVVAEPVLQEKRRPGRPRKNSSAPVLVRERKKPSEPIALSRPVHHGPVVVSSVQLEAERQRRVDTAQAKQEQEQVVPAEIDLDALTRNIAARWLTA